MSNGSHYLVDGNEIEKGDSDTTGDTSIQEILSIQHNVDTFEIKNNYIQDGGNPVWGGEGIVAKQNSYNGLIHNNVVSNVKSTGIYVDAYALNVDNISVYNNRLYNTGNNGIGISAEAGGTANDIHIYNNIVSGAQVGIRIPEYNDGTKSDIKNIEVINNNIYNNGGSNLGGGGGIWIGQYPNSYINGLVVRNNIVSQNYQYQIMQTPNANNANIVIDNNLIDGYNGYTNEILGTSNITGNPLFVNTNGGDFHLQSTSPAIDKGSPVNAPNIDFDGKYRPSGSGYDIGAFEYSRDN